MTYLSWRLNELLLTTQYGLLRLVGFAHPEYERGKTTVRFMKDNSLWEWGL